MSSGSCCESTCPCDDWLTSFCDYETISHKYCGTTQEFTQARRKAIPRESSRADQGVHQSDAIWYISDNEFAVESGIGATITDADGVEWTVYRAKKLKNFCVWKLNARSVEVCFQLTDKVEILERSVCGDTCAPEVQWNVAGKTRGKILTTGGTASSRNQANSMQVRRTASLVRWPAGEHPNENHFLRTRDGMYRITQFTDGGPFVPYSLQVELTDAECPNC